MHGTFNNPMFAIRQPRANLFVCGIVDQLLFLGRCHKDGNGDLFESLRFTERINNAE